MTQSAVDTACPICVDLDGTLIRSDVLCESVLLMLRSRPVRSLLMPLWLLRGRAHLKRKMAELVMPDPKLLPYRQDVLDFLKAQKQAGRRIVLVTASDQSVARAVADHLGIFDEAIGSSDGVNRRSSAKLATIREKVGTEFDYIGDSRADLVLWEAAKGAYLVDPGWRLLSAARRRCEPRDIFVGPGGRAGAMLHAIRPQQWVKNLLVLLPLILAHQAGDAVRVGDALLAFVSFCLCASAVYLGNDLLDIEFDRLHPRKRYRSFAAGTVPIQWGIAMAAGLLLAAFALAGMLGERYASVLLLYLISTTAYSLVFKGRLLMDVILLAGLYTLRLIAGAAAARVELSPWLLAFSMFFFISLAFVKRYSELLMLQLSNQRETRGRGYMVDDLEVIRTVGPTSGYLAVLVFCQYISTPTAAALYKRPMFLWLMCPVLLYWITRIWVLAHRRVLSDDPVVFAIKDRMSWIAAAVTLLLALAATV